jgi:RimJ/RimL family protein N-acetyltransferase
MACHLETERMLLRPWADSDVDAYRALVADRGGEVPSVESIQERIGSQRIATSRTGIALLATTRRAEGDVIGYCGLIVGRSSVDEPEIAFELMRHAHRVGYATEAAAAVIEAAVATGRSRLWATVGIWNTPSFRVLEKLGFERHHSSNDDSGELVWLTRELP